MPAKPATDQDPRDQEVVRANRELAAYFRGARTEREARGALKIIKAFVRERERTAAAKRRPLPGLKAKPIPKTKHKRNSKRRGERRQPTAEPTAAPTSDA